MKLKILDLFSGLGGFSLGLERTGNFETVAFCEIDKYCTLLLQKHWKGVKIYNDVKEITKERLEADGVQLPDVITGGFPCQPFSVAGKQKGTSDDRHLWPEMFRIIKEFTPRWVVGENVKGITNIQDGMVFEAVCTDLEGEGYEVRTFNIPAAGVGAPHRRERMWIVAHSSKFGCGSRSNNWEGRQVPNNEARQFTQDQSKQQRWESRSREESNTGSTTESRNNQGNEFRRQDLSGSKNVEDSRRTLRQGTELREKNEDEIRKEDANQHQRSGSPSESDVADTHESGSGERKISGDLNDEGRRAGETRREGLQSEDRQTRTDNIGSGSEDVADTQGKGTGENNEGIWQRSSRISGRQETTEETLSDSERERLQGSRRQESRGDFYGLEQDTQGNENEIRSESERRSRTLESKDVADTGFQGLEGTINEKLSTTERSTDVADTEGSLGNDFQTIARDGESETQEVSGDGSSVRGESAWWDVEPDVGRVAHGIPGRVHRLKGLGNSIVPQIAQEIGNAIIKAEREK